MPAALSSKPEYKALGKFAYGEIELEEGSRLNAVVRGISSLKAAEEASGQKDGKYLIGDRIIIVKNGTSYDTTGRVIDN